jgi:hypothetical protein
MERVQSIEQVRKNRIRRLHREAVAQERSERQIREQIRSCYGEYLPPQMRRSR